MDIEQKPFACKMVGCGMSFTNDDHLNVHRKKHDMILNLSHTTGNKNSNNFIADQTPTPTRLIRNCDEVGLFDDLQHVNPFDETFRRAVESKSVIGTTDTHIKSTSALFCISNHLEAVTNHNEDTLHTPQLPYFSITGSDEKDIAKEKKSLVSTGEIESNFKLREVDNAVSVITETSPRVLDTKTSQESPVIVNNEVNTPTVNAVKNVIILPVLQSAPVCDIPAKKLKSILPVQMQAQPQFVQIISAHEDYDDDDVAKTPRTKPLKKLCPKIEITQPPEINPVKEKLKEALLKTKLNTISTANGETVVANQCVNKYSETQFTNTKLLQVSVDTEINQYQLHSNKTTNKTNKTKDRGKDDKVFERNRAAAQRYRNKLKNMHNEIQQQNTDLMTENKRLKAELKALKILLLAHQDCSVSRSLALGKPIQIGLPTITVQPPVITPTVIVSHKSTNLKSKNSTLQSIKSKKTNAPS